MNSKKTIKSAFESMMFIWGQPLDVKSCADIFLSLIHIRYI